MNLQHKVAVVTGGASGIGRAAALMLAREGARVTVADVTEEGGAATVEEIRAWGGEAIFVRTDVSSGDSVETMIRKTVETFGRLDCACNNAGIEGVQAPLAESAVENWERVIGVNLTGVWFCMKHEIPRMLAAGGGSIVNVSSVAGLVGFPNISAYVASKFGVEGLTRAAALDYARRNIRVNTIAPGVIRTAMVDRVIGGNPEVEAQYTALEPVGRLGTPQEVAEAILWLCSDASSFVTGTTLAVDGGFRAR